MFKNCRWLRDLDNQSTLNRMNLNGHPLQRTQFGSMARHNPIRHHCLPSNNHNGLVPIWLDTSEWSGHNWDFSLLCSLPRLSIHLACNTRYRFLQGEWCPDPWAAANGISHRWNSPYRTTETVIPLLRNAAYFLAIIITFPPFSALPLGPRTTVTFTVRIIIGKSPHPPQDCPA